MLRRCTVDQASQGYSSSSSSNRAATLFQRRRASRPTGGAPAAPAAPHVHPLPEGRLPAAAVLQRLASVPLGPPSPLARVHVSVARLYAEIVLLPDLQPQEDPADALKVSPDGPPDLQWMPRNNGLLEGAINRSDSRAQHATTPCMFALVKNIINLQHPR